MIIKDDCVLKNTYETIHFIGTTETINYEEEAKKIFEFLQENINHQTYYYLLDKMIKDKYGIIIKNNTL